jgi:hydrogenase maturation protein HypF
MTSLLKPLPDAQGPPIRRLQLVLQGQVQGVGLRPFVYRLAQQCALSGFVSNNSDAVVVEVQGANPDAFCRRFWAELPFPANVQDCHRAELPVQQGETDFAIAASSDCRSPMDPLADLPPCDACLAELFNPQSRYFLYPFISCAQCGPRYSITRAYPFDRANTSMAAFPLCPDCTRQYQDPADRRFHAQTISCPTCGPRYDHPLAEVAACLGAGGLVAIKAIGGYQLLCDAHQPAAIQRLRNFKQRQAKPLALMTLNPASAQHWVQLNDAGRHDLQHSARPIVIAPAHLPLPLLAPNLNSLGVMLPNSALHYLLFYLLAGQPTGTAWLQAPSPLALVISSGNAPGYPMAATQAEAEHQLASEADLVVGHGRDIVAPVDDGIRRQGLDGSYAVRTGRGAALLKTPWLMEKLPTILALGGQQKSTVTLAIGNAFYTSEHLGDLDSRARRERYRAVSKRLTDYFKMRHALVAHDLHPDYYSSRLLQLGQSAVAIQHHHAHVAAVMAEHQLQQPLVAVALDGFGYGPRGEAWGGEFFYVKRFAFERVDHLPALPLLGGERASLEPWRSALATLFAAHDTTALPKHFSDLVQARAYLAQPTLIRTAPPTSSAGRWFDAAAALILQRSHAEYDGQFPLELEALVRPEALNQDLSPTDLYNDLSNDLSTLIRQLLQIDSPTQAAALFHQGMADCISRKLIKQARAHQVSHVVLAGGCMLNAVLRARLRTQLNEAGLDVFCAERIPSNDAGISLGQALLAAHYADYAVSLQDRG